MQCVFAGISAVLVAVLMPMMLIQLPKTEVQPQMLLVVEENAEEVTIRVNTGSEVCAMSVEAYLEGVVMAEMPLSFPQEALKAQAVAARTYTYLHLKDPKHDGYDLCTDGACCQAWVSKEQMREKLGDSWKTYEEKAKLAVEATKDQVLTYEGMLIDAVYFSCSGGHSESAAAVWGSDVTYLQAVESPGEEWASCYSSSVELPLDVFCATLRRAKEEVSFSTKPSDWVGGIARTKGGGVESVVLGGVEFAGTQLRQLFGLNSTLFALTIMDDKAVFSVHGNGHRVGMSQYGAAAMADAGKDYEEILRYYYQGTDLQKAPR